jgi:hypothetical protein
MSFLNFKTIFYGSWGTLMMVSRSSNFMQKSCKGPLGQNLLAGQSGHYAFSGKFVKNCIPSFVMTMIR